MGICNFIRFLYTTFLFDPKLRNRFVSMSIRYLIRYLLTIVYNSLLTYFEQEIRTRSLKRLMHALFPVQSSRIFIASTVVRGLCYMLVKQASYLKIHLISKIIRLKIYEGHL